MSSPWSSYFLDEIVNSLGVLSGYFFCFQFSDQFLLLIFHTKKWINEQKNESNSNAKYAFYVEESSIEQHFRLTCCVSSPWFSFNISKSNASFSAKLYFKYYFIYTWTNFFRQTFCGNVYFFLCIWMQFLVTVAPKMSLIAPFTSILSIFYFVSFSFGLSILLRHLAAFEFQWKVLVKYCNRTKCLAALMLRCQRSTRNYSCDRF